jgi:LuxR family maltose regulon positive regulatory protein
MVFPKTKFLPPALEATLTERSRIVTLLNDYANKKLVFLQTPCGYGKSIAAAQFIQANNLNYLWINLDEQDNEKDRFIQLLLTALGEAFPEFRGRPFDSASKTVSFLKQIADCGNHPAEPRYLFFDDYQWIDNEAIHQFVKEMAEAIPYCWHIYVLTNQAIPDIFVPLLFGSSVSAIGVDSLQFNREETEEYFDNAGLSMTKEDIDSIWQTSRGWAAGLTAIGLSARRFSYHGQTPNDPEIFTGFVNDYLDGHFWQCQTPEMKTFLLKIAIVDLLYPDLCQSLCPGIKAAASLQAARDHGALMIQDANHEMSKNFRFHPMFQKYLLYKAKSQKRIPLTALNEVAADWYARNQYYSHALDCLLHSRNYEKLAALLIEVTPGRLSTSEIMRSHVYLDALPVETIKKSPILSCASMFSNFLSGNIEAATRWDEVCRAMFAEIKEKAEISDQEDTFIRCYSGVKILMPYFDVNRIQESFEQDCAILKGRQSKKVSLHVTMNLPSILNGICDFSGYLDVEGRKMKEIHALVRNINGADWTGHDDIASGEIAYQFNLLDRAQSCAIEGLNKGEKNNNINAIFPGYALLIMALQKGGFYEDLNALLEHVEAAIKKAGAAELMPNFEAFRVKICLDFLSERDIDHWMDSFHNQYIKSSIGIADYYRFSVLVRILIRRQRYGVALLILEKLLDMAMIYNRRMFCIEVLVLKAIAQFYNGNLAEAGQSMLEAVEAGKSLGFLRIFIDEGPAVEIILSHLLRVRGKNQYSPRTLEYMKQLLAASKADTLLLSEKKKGSVRVDDIPVNLSLTERKVLRLLSTDRSNSEIAAELGVSVSTIKTHTNNIYQKLQVSRRYDAVDKAAKLNLI